MCNADHAFISAKWWARVVLTMMWWPIDPIFNYSSSSEDRDERRTTSTSLKKSGSGKENNKPESASSKNSRSQGFGLPVNNVNAGSNLMSNLPTRTSSKPKATPTKIGTKNWVYSGTKVNMPLFKNLYFQINSELNFFFSGNQTCGAFKQEFK